MSEGFKLVRELHCFFELVQAGTMESSAVTEIQQIANSWHHQKPIRFADKSRGEIKILDSRSISQIQGPNLQCPNRQTSWNPVSFGKSKSYTQLT
ncbi:MAG: hypothetical protein WBA89_03720 [Microcoleus sp.]